MLEHFWGGLVMAFLVAFLRSCWNQTQLLGHISESNKDYLEEVLGRRSQGSEQHLHLFVLSAGREEGSASVDLEDEAA